MQVVVAVLVGQTTDHQHLVALVVVVLDLVIMVDLVETLHTTAAVAVGQAK
jgi:hypothetical protein